MSFLSVNIRSDSDRPIEMDSHMLELSWISVSVARIAQMQEIQHRGIVAGNVLSQVWMLKQAVIALLTKHTRWDMGWLRSRDLQTKP